MIAALLMTVALTQAPDGVAEALEARGVRVDAGAERRVEVVVVEDGCRITVGGVARVVRCTADRDGARTIALAVIAALESVPRRTDPSSVRMAAIAEGAFWRERPTRGGFGLRIALDQERWTPAAEAAFFLPSGAPNAEPELVPVAIVPGAGLRLRASLARKLGAAEIGVAGELDAGEPILLQAGGTSHARETLALGVAPFAGVRAGPIALRVSWRQPVGPRTSFDGTMALQIEVPLR